MKRLFRSTKVIALAIALLMSTSAARADMFETAMKVDTLKLRDMIALRTNVVDWLMLTPNIGIEVDVKNRNWGMWTIGADVWFNPQTKHSFSQDMVYNTFGGTIEFREYWRTRKMSDEAIAALVDSATIKATGDEKLAREWHSSKYDPLGFHTNFIDRLFSIRHKYQKHPKTTYYRGFFAGYNDFSIKLGHTGYQGKLITAGITFGIVRPLYIFKNYTSLDIDFGIKLGAGFGRIDSYTHNSESNCYPVKDYGKWQMFKYPVVQDIRVGLIYRLGKKNIGQKYRKRYDVDLAFRNRMDSLFNARYIHDRDTRYSKRIMEEIGQNFEYTFDSLYFLNRKAEQQKMEEDIISMIDTTGVNIEDSAKVAKVKAKAQKKVKSLSKKSESMAWTKTKHILSAHDAGMVYTNKKKNKKTKTKSKATTRKGGKA